MGQAVRNGKRTDKAIRIFREPPLITFAKQRKQVTTLDIKLLQTPLSKTDGNLLIQDYLLERISKEKNNKKNRKKHEFRIIFETLYKHTNITTKKQKQRAAGKITKYLDQFKKVEFITFYEMEKDGVTIKWQ